MAYNNRLHSIVGRVQALPAPIRERVLSAGLGRIIRYAGTSGVRIHSLTPERSELSLPNAPHVRNHIGGLHAVAMALLVESATGYIVGLNVPDSAVP